MNSGRALLLTAVLAAVGPAARAGPGAPACVRAEPGDLTVLHGRRLRDKRVFFRFHLAKAVLFVDYASLDAALSPPSGVGDDPIWRFAQRARETLRAAMANAVEVDGRDVIADDPNEMIVRFLAHVVENGAFEVREREKTTLTLFRLAESGPRHAGRRFMLANCTTLFWVTDRSVIR